MDDAITGAKRYSSTIHDEIRERVMGYNVHRLGICGCMAKGLHH
jgi:hypothetical protein